MSLRVVFMGTPAFAAPVLEAILGAGHQVAAVYSQPPRPAGRGMADRKSPVHLLAEAHDLPVATPRNFKGEEERRAFAAHETDAAVVVAYGLLLPKAILDAPRLGCFNAHASALPRWRGAAPIQRSIMAGDTETAVTIMRMDEGLDTGPVCLASQLSILPDMTAGELHDTLAGLSASLMTRALARLEAGALLCLPQPAEDATYAAKIDKAEARIDFSRPARDVHNLVRGLSPSPGAWFEAGAPEKLERIKVLRSQLAEGAGAPGEVLDGAGTIACGDGAIRLVEVQRAGKRAAGREDFLRGFPLPRGTRFGEA